MRHTVQQQQKLVALPEPHPHAQQLAEISAILDRHPEIYDLIHADLVAGLTNPDTGREGMTAEQVLRCLLVKQMTGFSYEVLAFSIVDSLCYRAFCRIGIDGDAPTKKTLQRNIKRIRSTTLEAVNRVIIGEARWLGIERGRTVRTDCTVEETNIHDPSDSSLLYDTVRVLGRLMGRGREAGYDLDFIDHTRRAKRRALEIQHAKGPYERWKLYHELVKITEATIGFAVDAITVLDDPPTSISAEGLLVGLGLTTELEHFIPLGRQVVLQTKRRVFWKQSVPAGEKLVSIFEPHTDVIKKERRETLFGHKLCLTTGKSGLVLDCIVLSGNPADSTLAVEAVERQRDLFGRVPRQTSFDGGFASKANLAAIKSLGVRDVMFHKRRGLSISEMAKSTWVYKRLRRFRAGVEGGISFLKRCFGLGRCTWRSLASFEAYTWASVLSANLLMLSRLILATE